MHRLTCKKYIINNCCCLHFILFFRSLFCIEGSCLTFVLLHHCPSRFGAILLVQTLCIFFAPVLSQEPNMQWLSFVGVFQKCFSFFIYIRPLVSLFEYYCFFASHTLAIYSCLFDTSQYFV